MSLKLIPDQPLPAPAVGHVATNSLLAALAVTDLAELAPYLSAVTLGAAVVLCEADEPMRTVYFPLTSVVSVMSCVAGSAVEFGTVGSEGMIGLPVLVGDSVAGMRAVVQVGGEAMQCDAESFRRIFDRSDSLQQITRRYAHALTLQAMQSTACTSTHRVDQRCARWLLMTADRTGSNRIEVTHEFIAEMLNVRRAGVTSALRGLQSQSAVRCGRGAVTISNRVALESASCECYAIVSAAFERLLGPAHVSTPAFNHVA